MRSLRVSSLHLLFAALVLFLGLVNGGHAQVVSAGLTGTIMDNNGTPISGASVSAVHVPTGTAYSATSRPDGRFNFRSLIVGGPYTLTATSAGGAYKPAERTSVTTKLGEDVEVNLYFPPDGDVVVLEKFTVDSSRDGLDSNSTGTGTVLDSARLAGKPTTQRALADLISASPQVTLRATSGDREESQISALGQNARYNSIMIDGARINDQFGLNMSGLASFFNPLSLETLEQLSVAVSPYDVRQSGFTGAIINAVTKSGTNQFHGSLYYMFTGDEWLGVQMQGEDVATRKTQNIKNVPKVERTTYGATFGGPLWRNKLFFFTSYEKLELLRPPSDPGFNPGANHLAAISSQLQTATGINWGAPGGSVSNSTEEEKILAKIDWNIFEGHRLSVRYSTTEGELPQYGSFTATTGARGINTSPSGAGFALDSYFYAQARKEKAIAGQFISQWTSEFKTELKYSKTNADQLTPTNSTLPLLNIFGVPGTSQSGAPISGFLFAGTEFSRQGNEILVDTESYSATGDYFLGNFVLTGGFDREESDFVNLFRSGSYGQFDLLYNPNTLTLGLTPYVPPGQSSTGFTRSFYDPALRPASDLSNFSVTGLFFQGKWDVNPRLSFIAGLRVDAVASDSRPRFNDKLFAQTGFRNDGTVDGVKTISPRVGFNLAVDKERLLQLRGGAGRFLGRTPWVLFSNSYNQLGVGTYTSTTAPTSLVSYLANDFNLSNPIGAGTDSGVNDREVDWTDDKIKLPSVIRGNLAVDRRLLFLGATATAEFVKTYTDQAFFIKNENLKPLGVGADGRPRFSGNPGASAAPNFNNLTALYPDFTNLYHIMNTGVGESTYLTLSLDRPMKNRWSYNAAYTRGRSTDAQVFGSTTAGSQWGRNAVFYQNQVVESRSDFEVKNRVQLTITREFEFVRDWKTLVSLYYEGRTGSPFSYVYTGDLNSDNTTFNDLIAVPTGLSDPRFDFSGLVAAGTVQDYFNALERTGLSRYAGSYAPRNAFDLPWVNRLDLRLSQKIPIYRPAELELFLDFTNFGALISEKVFGYYERSTFVESDTYWRRTFGNAAYNSSGLVRPTYGAPSDIVYDNPQSRWRLQVGAKLLF